MLIRKENKYYQLVLNTLLFALGSFGSKFIVFILMPLYTNTLTTEEYGISELVITATNLLIPFVTVSIQDATLRFSLDKNNNSDEVLKNTLLILSVGTIISCLLYPLMRMYKAVDGWTQYLLILTILYMIRNALSIYLKAIGKTKLYAVDSIVYTLLLMVSNIILLTVFKLRLAGYFYGTIISTVGSIILLIIFNDVIQSCRSGKVNLALLKSMIRFSSPMIFNNISWWIINSSDKVMIGYYISTADSGIYSVAAKMPSLLITLTNIFNQAWIISSVTEYDTTNDGDFYSNTFNSFNAMLIMAASGIILIIKPFMQIYVGHSFVECWQYVPLLLLGSVFQSYATFFGAIYTSAKKNVSVMVSTLVAAAINLILNAILIPTVGIQGAVIATAIAYFVVFLFRMLDSRKYVNIRINTWKVLLSMMILFGQCILIIVTEGARRYFVSALLFCILICINSNDILKIVKAIKARIL